MLDPRIGQRAGFGGPILHGLSTFGFAARAVLKSIGSNDPAALLAFGTRFTSPVKPGGTRFFGSLNASLVPCGTTGALLRGAYILVQRPSRLP